MTDAAAEIAKEDFELVNELSQNETYMLNCAQGCMEENAILNAMSTEECKLRWFSKDDYQYGFL